MIILSTLLSPMFIYISLRRTCRHKLEYFLERRTEYAIKQYVFNWCNCIIQGVK